ncbi:hypothetical protein E4U21_002765 [Claviceps maximensis]|nr:hypothetical protein E4U21_002765 [Claviceps maximensis]
MEQWQVGPVPEYVYSNSTHPPNDMHNHSYQTDMSRRTDQRMEFPYGAPQASLTPQQQQQPPQQPPPPPQQQHHSTPVQQPMTIPQASNASTAQQQSQTPTPAQQGRQRKRPAPNTAPSPATAASAAPNVAASQVQPSIQNIAAPQATSAATASSAGAPPPPPQSQAPAQDVNAMAGQPPVKKSRTNTPWTPQEELRLKQMRDAGNSWAEIAKTFPTRTEGSVKKHWYKDMHYAEFAEDESQALLNAIKEYENNKWKVIGQKVGKPAKACEQYAKEHFPDLFLNSKGR